MGYNLEPGDKVFLDGEKAEIIRKYNVGDLDYIRAVIDGETKNICLDDVSLEKDDEIHSLKDIKESELDPLSGIFNAKKFNLYTKALRLKIAHRKNQLLSISNSLVRLEPYQLACVNQVMKGIRQRCLIADDVGLGKTVEAGLIFKELLARDRIDKAIFVVPAHLQKKWKKDMDRFFNIDMTIADRTWVEAEERRRGQEANIWDQEGDILLTSMAFIRQDEFDDDVEDAFWDISIVDEAHKASKRGESPSKTSKTVEKISHRSDSLLLLTATPHNGKLKPFRSLISYIDPFIVPPEEELEKSDIEDVMVRRGKRKIFDEDGERIFPDREVKTVPVEPTESEIKFYNEVTEYVKTNYNRSNKLNEPAVGFAMALMQKRLVSSIRAIKLTLKRRLENLLEFDESELSRLTKDYLSGEELEGSDKEEAEKELEKLTTSKNDEELEKEIKKLKSLVEKAKSLPLDSKGRKVSNFVKNLLREHPDEKLIIFTEYKDTLNYIVEEVLGEEFSDDLLIIHGGVDRDERERIENLFNHGKPRILVATDAASEGIDLQHNCHIMVNYELPWNPNKLEQRIGRIHRYGQDKEVKVSNFQLKGTRESEIFELLEDKIENIRNGVGSTADMVGILDNIEIEELIMESIKNEKPPKATKKEIEEKIEERQKTLEEWYERTPLEPSTFDEESRKKIREVVDDSEEAYGSEEDIKDFFSSAIDFLEGKMTQINRKVFKLEGIGDLDLPYSANSRITFDRDTAMDKEDVKFISPDSELMSKLISLVLDKEFGGETGIKILPFLKERGITFNYLVRYEDGNGELIEEKVVPVHVKSNSLDTNSKLGEKTIKRSTISPIPDKNKVKKLFAQKDALKEKADKYISSLVKNRRKELKERRMSEVNQEKGRLQEYKEKELRRIQEFIDTYKEKRGEGEDMEIAIRGQKSRKEKLKKRLEDRKEHLEKKAKVISIAPEVKNYCICTPS